jgi:hypothetical protein
MKNIKLEPGSVILTPEEAARLRAFIDASYRTVTAPELRQVLVKLGREIRAILHDSDDLGEL